MTFRVLLRIEGALVFLAALTGYHILEIAWWVFFVLLLTPDLFIVGYLAGPRVGAHLYNAGHTYALPLVIGSVAVSGMDAGMGAIALIWTAHIGMDRALGYGLKRPSGFHDTHLTCREDVEPNADKNETGPFPAAPDGAIRPRPPS